MSSRIAKREAEAAALRLAEELIKVSLAADSPWLWECGTPHPQPGPNGRKPFLKWIVPVRWISRDGGVFDSNLSVVHVDLETKQARLL
jgi:hypothetical protein